MIEPLQADDALLADIATAARSPAVVHLWWLGQSGFLIQHAGRHLLVDPYLSDSLTQKYAATDKPHVRMTRQCIAAERLAFVDAITSSHNHTDHLDAATLRPILAANRAVELIVPAANRPFVAERLGISQGRLIAVDAGAAPQGGLPPREFGAVSVAGFEIIAVPAAHDAIERDEGGRHRYLGYVIRCGGKTIYHSGDTRLYAGMAELLRPFAVDVALLPINGAAPQRRVAGNLSGVEAAELAHAIGARVLVPCHYDMFAFNTASPDECIARATQLGQEVKVLRCGERLTVI
jgi:L-ascorbate metabolism protein UlaG (beta-lactamase superfamily)